MQESAYKQALARERMAREQAEHILETKSQELYLSNRRLKENNAELMLIAQELKQAKEQLIHSEKMSSLGQMAAGVAHEINNPIGYISSNMQSMSRDVQSLKALIIDYQQFLDDPKNETIKEQIIKKQKNIDLDFLLEDLDAIFDETKEGLNKITSIVNGLKTFSHADEEEIQEIDVRDCLKNAIKVSMNEIKYKATLHEDYQEVRAINCYPNQLSQVFINCLVNAAQSISNKGDIYIKTYELADDICVEIADTGCGMSKEDQQKIFDPFFTTKPVGEGTGLGLAISYGIIEKHGGRIKLKSKKGKGTTFIFKLPKNFHINDEPICVFFDED